MTDSESQAYARICQYAKDRDCSIVLRHKHFGNSLCLVKTGSLIVGMFYQSLFEQFYDMLGIDGKVIEEIPLDRPCRSFEELAIYLDLNEKVHDENY